MAQDKLTVSIGADISDLQKGISQAEKEIQDLKKVKADNIKIGADTSQINTAIDQAKAKLATLQKSATGAENAMQGFQKQTANGGVALTAFSRIAQDAPYGIIGIGNNITNTAEQFGYLAKQTGSAGGAVKAMLSSLAGIGGVMLGVSLLVTGLTVMAQKGITVGDVIDKLTGKYDAFKESMNKLAVDQAKNSGQEIANMNALVSVAQNDLKSKQDRLTAVEELQNQFPGYFGNLTKEQILTGDLSTVTKELTKAIIARAEASAIADKIGELAAKKLDAQIKKEKAILKLKEAQKFENYNISSGGTLGANANISNETRLARATSNVKDLNQEIADIQSEQNKLASMQNLKTAQSIKLLAKKASVAKLAKPKPKATRDQFATQDFGTTQSGLFEAGKITIGFDQEGVSKAFEEFNARVGTEMTMTQKIWEQFSLDLSDIIETGTEDALIGFGESIGNAFAEGANVFQAAGASLIGSIGNVISSVGKELVKMGILAQGYAAVVKWMQKAFTNPYALAAAGVALVAIGAAISSSAKRVGTGGSGSSSTGGGGSSSNYSTSSGGFSTAGASGGTVVFEIAGQKLIGVLSNTINGNLRLGGQNTLRL
jgi:hypothetical protein